MFIDNGVQFASLLDFNVTAGSYTSDAIVIDSSRASSGSRYGYDAERHVVLNVRAINSNNDGVGISFRTTGGNIISFITGYIHINGFSDGIFLDTSDNVINGNFPTIFVVNSTNLIHHSGSSNANSIFYGQLQPAGGGATDRIIYNEGTAESITFFGQAWDAGDTSVSALDGEKINVFILGEGTFGLSKNSSNASTDTVVIGMAAGGKFRF